MEKIYDLIIIGGGPSGLSASIYAGRAKMNVLVIEKGTFGGQITLTNDVVNYPGILGTTGSAIGEKMKKQAQNFGVEFAAEEVVGFDFNKDIKEIKTSKNVYKTLSVIIATGSSPRKLRFPGEEEYIGRGVAFCATCDGEFFTGMDVFVIGAGFAAAEEAMFLTKFAKKVTIIAREPEFTCAQSISDKVLAHPKIEVKFNSELLEATGDVQLRAAKIRNNVTGVIEEYKAPEGESFGIFVFVGYEPQSKIFKDVLKLDEAGYISTDEDLMTNIKGVYASGDIRPKKLKQLVTAVSDGATAATNSEKYCIDLREELGLKPQVKEAKKETEIKGSDNKFIDESLAEQLKSVVEKFENNIELVVIKNPSMTSKSDEVEDMLREIALDSDKLKFTSLNKGDNPELEAKAKVNFTPTTVILDKDRNFKNIKYSTLPSGHELNSFILAMYNVAGPGQKISNETIENIKKINKPVNVKLGISLTCTKCPELVQAAQRIAIENDNIDLEIVDVFTFKDFKEQFEIMSVPAMVVNDKDTFFGQKDTDQILEILHKYV